MRGPISLILLSALLGGCAQSPVDEVKQTFSMKAQADAYYAKRDCANAMPLYRRLNDDIPNYTEGWLRIGNCQVFLNNLDDAVLAYRQAIARDPGYVKAWHNLAQVQARMLGQTVSEMYRSVDPTDPMAKEVRRFAMEVLDAFEQPARPEAAPDTAAALPAAPAPAELVIENGEQ